MTAADPTSAGQSEPRLPIGEVAERTGLSVHALRFYEQQDLLIGPVSRTSGGRRAYTATDVEWLQICVKLRQSRMPLTQLQRYAALVRRGPGNEHERLALLDEHRLRIEAQIQALQECREVIDWKVAVYGEHVRAGSAAGVWAPTSE